MQQPGSAAQQPIEHCYQVQTPPSGIRDPRIVAGRLAVAVSTSVSRKAAQAAPKLIPGTVTVAAGRRKRVFGIGDESPVNNDVAYVTTCVWLGRKWNRLFPANALP
jgi:hypothetical protein